ncbi:hypothetical protein TWF694_005107 [Orbilia ellipsospora]|uniref:PWWP domain-containing protein n=1 Tax=Orbilia ellipsospora TaxID=2528407 RepID=A0AAV9WUM4_9PEZI
MADVQKAKSPAPPAAPETSSEVKETASEVPSTVAPVEKVEVPAPVPDTKPDEPEKSTESASAHVATKTTDDANDADTEDKPAEKPAPQALEDQETTQTTEPIDHDADEAVTVDPGVSDPARPSRAAAVKAQEATKPRTPVKKKSSANLAGAAAASSAGKRKSFGGKAGPDMELKAGMIVLARLKGYSPWPAIIVEEDMLPPTVLKARPKDSTSKRKGKFSMAGLADDEIPIAARGSSAGHWPIMFLDNFESFSWTMFTEIMPLDDTAIDAFSPRGKAKDIVRAYENAKKRLTLDDIRDLKAEAYVDPEEEEAEADAMDVDEPEEEEEEEEEEVEVKPAKGKKKAPAKETASKKRKAEGEAEDTTKTPKKVNTGKNVKTPASSKTKTPVNGASKKKSAEETPAPAPKSSSKKRTAAVASEEEEDTIDKSAKKKSKGVEKKQEKDDSPEEAATTSAKAKNLTVEKDQKEKEVMYLRHKIQKALLTTEKVPTEQEVVNIDHYFQKLESYPKLEVAIIKKTKINKVLKALLRLSNIPFDEKYKFKDRTLKLLDEWNQLLANDPEASGAEPNGVKKGSSSSSKDKTKSKSPEDNEQKPEDPKEQVEISGADAAETEDSAEKKDEKLEKVDAPDTVAEASTEESKDEAVTKTAEAGKEVAAEA